MSENGLAPSLTIIECAVGLTSPVPPMLVTTGTIVNMIVPVVTSIGGTGLVSPTAHSIMVSEGASPFSLITCSSSQVLAGVTGSDPICRTLNNGDLPNSGVVAGSYTNTSITVNAQGIVT